MASKFVRSTDIPSNFSIAKYSMCEEWTLGQWSANLGHRLVRRDSIVGIGLDTKYARIMQDATSEAFDDPELAWSWDEEGPVGLNGEPWPAYAQRVRDVTSFEYLRAREHFEEHEFKRYAESYNEAIVAVDPCYPWRENPDATDAQWDAVRFLNAATDWSMHLDCMGDNYEFPPFALAHVDLNASDGELIEDFQAWLTAARKSRKIEPATYAFSDRDREMWGKMRILPFIDLTLWAQARGLKISLPVMGRALFPDEFDVSLEDRVRKVVADYAERLMNPRVIRAMHSQAMKSERKSINRVPE